MATIEPFDSVDWNRLIGYELEIWVAPLMQTRATLPGQKAILVGVRIDKHALVIRNAPPAISVGDILFAGVREI